MRSELKKNGKDNLKRHYFMFVLICLAASFIGSEFVSSSKIIKNISCFDINKVLVSKSVFESDNKPLNIKDENILIESKKDNNNLKSQTKRLFSVIINNITFSRIYSEIIVAVISMTKSKDFIIVFLILVSLAMFLVSYFFIENTFIVISRRIFLEGRLYNKIPFQRFLFLLKIKKWAKASFTMFIASLFKLLWSITIVGGIIKHYSYFLVPYIVSENPDIDSLDAITLSRQMMVGHKWECFILELSFIGWNILGVLTLGIINIFYTNPYKIATYSEYYNVLRKEAKKKKISLASYLNDRYLFEKADKVLLNKKYSDIITQINKKDKDFKEKFGIRGFLNKTFGISLFEKEYRKMYDEEQVRIMKKEKYKSILNQEEYPKRLYPIKTKDKKERFEIINYLRSYTIPSLILLFFSFALIGWVWEVALCLITNGQLVNKGTMHGPWLPIYGWGSILILTVLYKTRKNPKMHFLLIIILCGTVEYFTSYYLEINFGQKWWDYSNSFLNLNGRICAEGLLVFGLGGLAITYLIAPIIDNYIQKFNQSFLILICVVLLFIFVCDQMYSSKHPNIGPGITYYKASLFQMNIST